jgi:hypothetical protein
MASTTMKLLVPLSTAVVAGAVALGSSPEFTSQKGATVEVTAGDIVQYNSRDGLTLTLSNMKPGAVEEGTFVLRNDGSLNSVLTASATVAPNGFDQDVILLEVVQDGSSVWGPSPIEDFADVDLGQLDADPDGTGVAAGGSTDLTLKVSMDLAADNDNQAKSMTADLDFVLTQTDHATDDESGAQWSS